MPHKKIINKANTIAFLEEWSLINKEYFYVTAEKSKCCKKNIKWINNKEIPNCSCTDRDYNCVLSEVYYAANKLTKIKDYEQSCNEALSKIYSIQKQVYDYENWIENYAQLYYYILESQIINIRTASYPYKSIFVEVELTKTMNRFITAYETISNNIPENPFNFLNLLQLGNSINNNVDYLFTRYVKTTIISKVICNEYLFYSDFAPTIFELEPIISPSFFTINDKVILIKYVFDVNDFSILKRELTKVIHHPIIDNKSNLNELKFHLNNITFQLTKNNNYSTELIIKL